MESLKLQNCIHCTLFFLSQVFRVQVELAAKIMPLRYARTGPLLDFLARPVNNIRGRVTLCAAMAGKHQKANLF